MHRFIALVRGINLGGKNIIPMAELREPLIESLQTPTERFELTGRVFYLHAPDGIGRSKLAANAEKLLGVRTTIGNYRTVENLGKMSAE